MRAIIWIFGLWILPLYAIVYDVVIYGGTSAGVMAAIQAARLKKSVLLIEPGKHLGGMTSNGLGFIDIHNTKAIGGLCQEYFHNIWLYYQQDSSWIWQQKGPLSNQDGKPDLNANVMWLLEPHVGEKIFNDMIAKESVQVLFGESLDRKKGVKKNHQQIQSLSMISGLKIEGRMFIDASYEGDLMAASGVSYSVEREDNLQYGETLNGVFLNHATVSCSIDPYQQPGLPTSGLLPRVYPFPENLAGKQDKGVQSYIYRLCLTNIAQNRVSIDKPVDYDEKNYELLFRIIEAEKEQEITFFTQDLLPNGKIDANNRGPISMDFIGMSTDWAEADEAERRQIATAHEQWQRGLLWTLQNHPRVPAEMRTWNLQWGLSKDEFADNHHWPYQLYVREARRMISDFVLTEAYITGKAKTYNGIAVAAYMIDSHVVKYCVNERGLLTTEGGIGEKNVPVPISYRAIIPKRKECTNLFVPVCLSSTHVGFCGIRTEPIYMILGQSAAIAACLSIDLGLSIQDLPYETLKTNLLAAKQIIDWP